MRLAGVLACAALLVAVASVGSATAAPRARCAAVMAYGQRYAVSIEKGRVDCATARKVLRAFLSGKGRMHGPRHGPSYKQYWTLYGWSCGHGAGGGGCIRHGNDYRTARDWILAEWTRP